MSVHAISSQLQGRMDETFYFHLLEAAHEDFLAEYRNSQPLSLSLTSAEVNEVFENSDSNHSLRTSMPFQIRHNNLRWSNPLVQGTPSSSATAAVTPRWASRVLNRLPTSKFLVTNVDFASNTGESPQGGTRNSAFRLVPESRNQHELIPITQIQVSPSRGRPECEICLSDYESGDRLRHLPCNHVFHAACIDRWLQSAENCPKCRSNVVKTLARLQKEQVHRRAQSATSENLNSASSSRSNLLTGNQTTNSSGEASSAYRARSQSPNAAPIENRASQLRRQQNLERRHQMIRSLMVPREHLSGVRESAFREIEPQDNRASRLRRIIAEQRRYEALREPPLWSMNDVSESGLSGMARSSPGVGHSLHSTLIRMHISHSHHPATPMQSDSSIEARRHAVEAAMRRIGRAP